MLVASQLYNGRSEYLYRIPSEELYNKILNNMEYPNNINEDSLDTIQCVTTIWNVQKIISNKTALVL